MSVNPPPPHMSLNDYADWVAANLSDPEKLAQHILQKQIQEPPLGEPFRYLDDPASQQGTEPTVSWPKSLQP